jgi:small conductance mechanosensitive channel
MLLLIVASTLGIDVTGVVALASVLTLAISLSVQNTLTNVIGGFTLLSNKPFHSGDFVEIAAQSGTVKEVGLTYTKLCTGDNKTISIPNSAVVAAEIVNYTVAGTRRVEVPVSVSYDTPIEPVLEGLRQAANVPTALADPEPFAAVKDYDGGTMNCILHVWSNTEDYWTTLYQVNENVKTEFEKKEIKITCPHIYVHTDK